VLEEHVAAEGLPMVPQDALDAIIAQRNELSIVSRIGAIRYQTDKQIFNIPREVTAMTALALIAEEGAYVANEPAFGLLAITTLKYGSLIAATEELLEDQNLFIPWFTKACGRAWALAENAQFYTTCDVAANGTVYGAASDTLTLAEWNTWFWGLTAPYRDGSVIIMNQGTMAVLAGLLVATPYAFGGYPIMRLNAAGIVDIGGFPMYTVADWLLYSAAAALGLVLSMINPQFCGIVERRGMTIKVDPYSTAGTGIINYYPSVRFAPFVTQALAHSVKNGA
jgi:HK97 family phage major capsid protein